MRRAARTEERKPMTVSELIAELSRWPSEAEVQCAKEMKPPGVIPTAQITRVGGVAGAHISGFDSSVLIWHR